MVDRSFGASGYGAAYLKRIVYGSTISFATIAFVYAENGPGLFGTVGTRSIENTTSWAGNSLPSVNLTPLRSLNSHVLSSIAFHDIASPGMIFESGSIWTSLSKMCSAMLLFGKRLKKCGSIDVTSAATAIFSSSAPAGGGDAIASASAAQAKAAMGTTPRNTGTRMSLTLLIERFRADRSSAAPRRSSVERSALALRPPRTEL